MHEGLIPYRDIFDHKGPLLYFINYIGLGLSPNNYTGIWLIELLFIIIDLLSIYKIIKEVTGKPLISIFTACTIMGALSFYIQGGNFVEEYALPFILISLYHFIMYFENNKEITTKNIIIIGMCCGCVLMLRPNMIVVWIIYCIALVISQLVQKKYKEILKFILNFIIGNVSVILPFIIYLLINKALLGCFEQYILFNFKYADKNDMKYLWNLVNAFIKSTRFILLSIIVYGIALIKNIIQKNKVRAILINAIYFWATFIIIILPNNYYLHYMIILIPCLIYPISILIKWSMKKRLLYLLGIVIISVCGIETIQSTTKMIKNVIIYGPIDYELPIIEYVKKNVDENDEILVIGNQCSLYLRTQTRACSKYIYQTPIAQIKEDIIPQIIKDIRERKPQIILVNSQNEFIKDNSNMQETLKSLISNEEYILNDRYRTFMYIYVKNNGGI